MNDFLGDEDVTLFSGLMLTLSFLWFLKKTSLLGLDSFFLFFEFSVWSLFFSLYSFSSLFLFLFSPSSSANGSLYRPWNQSWILPTWPCEGNPRNATCSLAGWVNSCSHADSTPKMSCWPTQRFHAWVKLCPLFHVLITMHIRSQQPERKVTNNPPPLQKRHEPRHMCIPHYVNDECREWGWMSVSIWGVRQSMCGVWVRVHHIGVRCKA